MLMENVIATVTLKSRGGLSVYRDLEKLNRGTFKDFRPDEESLAKVREGFVSRGFYIEAKSEVGLTVSGPNELFAECFKVKISREKIKYIKDFEKYVYTSEHPLEPSFCQQDIERITLPRQSFELAGLIETEVPFLDYYHLQVPGQIRKVAKTEGFHNLGITGKGVNVVMIDTGLYNHRYYKENGFSFTVIPAVRTFDVTQDERGHGTAMSSVLLAVAPGVNLTMLKLADYYHSYPIAALQKAVELRPEIINCSWGTIGFEPHVYLEIANAVDKGSIMVFSSGNGSSDRRASLFQTICYPDVISVGGCFPNEDGTLEAADIASSYSSDIFPLRFAPDVCGICGKLPKAQLILFPTQPGCIFDRNNGKRDGTKVDDGWLVSSGTSAAAAYVSGLIALILQRQPYLKEDIKNVLQNTAIDVLSGASFMGNQANAPGWNRAVGFGFVSGDGISSFFTRKNSLVIRHGITEKTVNKIVFEHNYCNPDIIIKNEPVNQPADELGVNYKQIDDFSDLPQATGGYAYFRIQNGSLEKQSHRLKVYSVPIAPVINPLFWEEISVLEMADLQPGSFRVFGPVSLPACSGKSGRGVVVTLEGFSLKELENLEQLSWQQNGIFRSNNYNVSAAAGDDYSFYINNVLGSSYESIVRFELTNLKLEQLNLDFNGAPLLSGGQIIDPALNVHLVETGALEIRGISREAHVLEEVKVRITNCDESKWKNPSFIHVFQTLNDVKYGYLRFSFKD